MKRFLIGAFFVSIIGAWLLGLKYVEINYGKFWTGIIIAVTFLVPVSWIAGDMIMWKEWND